MTCLLPAFSAVLSVLPGSGMGTLPWFTPGDPEGEGAGRAPGWGGLGWAWARGPGPAGPGLCRLPPACLLLLSRWCSRHGHRDEAFETIFSQYMKITPAGGAGSDS